jgi:muconolactone delta-isomerase
MFYLVYMTKKLSQCTPQEAEKLRASAREYKRKNAQRLKAQAAARHAWRYANEPEYRARKDKQANEARMQRKYGIGTAERDKILKAQGGVCAICGIDKPGGRGGWHTDHCHTSGKVREILCTACNVYVGRIEKNPILHSKILNYIARHKVCQ